jgi:hypothetical protein
MLSSFLEKPWANLAQGSSAQDRSKSGEEILVYFSDKQRFKLAVLIDVDY